MVELVIWNIFHLTQIYSIPDIKGYVTDGKTVIIVYKCRAGQEFIESCSYTQFCQLNECWKIITVLRQNVWQCQKKREEMQCSEHY